ncbi:Replication termination factor 2 [Malassezia sp. CBS 17886]|nr:Replication termination factor 2 [Malassezia sp. CBS 17886]
MGADGGTIATRTDLVRTRAGEASYDRDEMRHSLWTLCRLTRQKLREPVMLDRLGQLYNKEGVIEYLLRRSTKTASDAENRVAGHLRSLKDVRPLVLHANPVQEADSSESLYYPYACPLTQRAMNGKQRFVCLWPNGHVFSESGLRHTAGLPERTKGDAPPEDAETPCPLTGTPFRHTPLQGGPLRADSDVVWINPPPAQQAELREQLAAARRQSTKRKRGREEESQRGGETGAQGRGKAGAARDDAGKDAVPPRISLAQRTRAACGTDVRPGLNEGAPGAYAAQQVRLAQANAAHNMADGASAARSEPVAAVHRPKRDVA